MFGYIKLVQTNECNVQIAQKYHIYQPPSLWAGSIYRKLIARHEMQCLNLQTKKTTFANLHPKSAKRGGPD